MFGSSSTTDLERLHVVKRERVAAALRAHPPGRPLSLAKRAVSHQVPKANDRARDDEKLDLIDLDAILAIDPVARTCVAEPGVTFTRLVEATLAYGLVPLVVPELATITIGGAVSGGSLESTSFRYGGFHDTCLAYEVVTATGEVLECTPVNEHRLVFQMMHGSFGTLGVLTKLVFALGRAKPFVHLRHERFSTLAAYREAIAQHADDQDVDFMDGIIHAPNALVLCLGTYADEAPYTSRYDWTQVYYRSTLTRSEDWLRTPDYFFRYDHGVTNVHPKSWVGRLLLGKAIDSAHLLRLAETVHRLLPAERPSVTLDVFVPSSKAPEFMRWYEEEIGFFPLWCVPYRVPRRYEWVSPALFEGIEDRLYLDLAIYGMRQPPGRNVYLELEEELARVHGIKTLISYNYYEEDAFWRIWNRESYDAVKAVTDPDNVFRDLYSKTCRAPRGLDDVPYHMGR